MQWLDAVTDRQRIHRQLDRLAARARGRRLDALVQDGVRFTQVLDDRERVVSLLSRALGDASYRPGAARMGRAVLGGKLRDVARVGVLDLVAHAVVADVLVEAIEPGLSPCLWSYRSGRSSWQALRAILRYVRTHRRQRPDPRSRGLYVLRSDVRSYTDEIPVDDDAPVWRELDSALGLDARASAMVRALVRPSLIGEDGRIAPSTRGVLFGLPTTTAIANLYLAPLDTALGRLEGVYARFGDDVLFASEDPARVREARMILDDVLGERGLAPNAKKLRVLFWNGAARPSPEWGDALPAESVAFLGAALRFDGTIALRREKWASLLHDIRQRIRHTGRLATEGDTLARAKLLCGVVNDAFDVRSELAVDYAQLVSDLVSDRAQLRQLDHLLALWIAEELTGQRGARAFREVPPRYLRRTAGLASRVVARNRPPS